jgi:hypothetical protein
MTNKTQPKQGRHQHKTTMSNEKAKTRTARAQKKRYIFLKVRFLGLQTHNIQGALNTTQKNKNKQPKQTDLTKTQKICKVQ